MLMQHTQCTKVLRGDEEVGNAGKAENPFCLGTCQHCQVTCQVMPLWWFSVDLWREEKEARGGERKEKNS